MRPRLHPLRRAAAPAALLVAAPVLAGCALFDGGSTFDDALELVPADSYQLRFVDQAATMERLGLDDIDPRAVSEEDAERFHEETTDEVALAYPTTWEHASRDAEFNVYDIEWEVVATWGEPDGDDDEDDEDGVDSGRAHVWKVGDSVDFDALVEDLVDNGYEQREEGDFVIAETDLEDATQGAAYPAPWMLGVLVAEDARLVVGVAQAGAMDRIVEVIADDADSLADAEVEGLDDVAGQADEVELASVQIDEGGCESGGLSRLTQADVEPLEDLGHPVLRALLAGGDDGTRFLLRYDDEDAAADDLEARRRLLEDGVDPVTAAPFDERGDFSVDQQDAMVVVSAEFERGVVDAEQSWLQGSGPAICGP